MTSFPPEFVWGAATAAYQIEGAVTEDGRGPSIWDTFTHTPGTILDHSTGDVADDHYHRYADDIALLADLGMTAYRFSIAWPRILPNGAGAVNQAGLDFYRRVAETCLELGVTPYATLYHWDLPQPLEDIGGWLERDTALRFADYAETTVSALRDVVQHWITLNEPWCSAFLGYAAGVHAPGKTLGAEAAKAAHHLLLGHGQAVQAVRDVDPSASVGITLNLYSIRAATDSAADREAARRADAQGNRLFLDPLLLGRYPEDAIADLGLQQWFGARDDDLATIATPLDFIGINYYSRQTYAAPSDGVFGTPGVISASPGSENLQVVDTGAPKTAMGWEVHPDGLIDVVEMIHRRAPELPVYITENGAAYDDAVTSDGTVDDADRRLFYELHVDACRLALQRGLNLQGYFAWSLLDNFEWAFGYSRRFGLIYVDFETQQRIVKASGTWFKEFLTS
jgi:beta-glucosidase